MSFGCKRLRPALLGLFLTGCFIGCSGTSASLGNEKVARGAIKVLGVEYANYVTSHAGKPPANREELIAFLESRKARIRGLEDVEQLLRSPRDSEPLTIFYGEKLPPAGDSGYAIIAHEKTKWSGKCLVVDVRGGVKEVLAEEIPAYFSAN